MANSHWFLNSIGYQAFIKGNDMYKEVLKDCVTGEKMTTQVQKIVQVDLTVKEVALSTLEVISKQPGADYKPEIHKKVSKGLKINDLSKAYLCEMVSHFQPAGVALAFKAVLMKGKKTGAQKKSSSR